MENNIIEKDGFKYYCENCYGEDYAKQYFNVCKSRLDGTDKKLLYSKKDDRLSWNNSTSIQIDDLRLEGDKLYFTVKEWYSNDYSERYEAEHYVVQLGGDEKPVRRYTDFERTDPRGTW